MATGSCDQGSDECPEEGSAAFAHIMNELEEAEVEGEFLLRDAAMRPEPGSQQGPDAFHGVDMRLVAAIAILVTRVFSLTVTDRLMLITPRGQARVYRAYMSCSSVLISEPGATKRVMMGSMVRCWTLGNIRITTRPPRWIMPKTGGFSFSRVPRPRAPLSLRRRPARPF